VLGWEGCYEVSRDGHVRRMTKGRNTHPGRVRKPKLTRFGYRQLALHRDGHRTHVFVHRLVWQAFNGVIAKGLVINHRNGIKTDNRLENLEVVTYAENDAHALRLGLKARGHRSPHAKLIEKQVREIRRKYAARGMSQETLAAEYGVGQSQISRIVRRKLWAWLEG
jgi:hypothetical protein